MSEQRNKESLDDKRVEAVAEVLAMACCFENEDGSTPSEKENIESAMPLARDCVMAMLEAQKESALRKHKNHGEPELRGRELLHAYLDKVLDNNGTVVFCRGSINIAVPMAWHTISVPADPKTQQSMRKYLDA